MTTTIVRRTTVALVVASTFLGVTACGGGSDVSGAATAASSTGAPSADSSTTAPAGTTSTSATSGAAPAAGAKPDWAVPATMVGVKISTIKVGDITVDVYQGATTAATKSGQFADPDTNKPIIAVGAPIVFLNYVITNTGAPINLGSSLVDVSARYDDWKYLQGMDSVVDSALFAQQKINTDALAPGSFKDPGIYPLGTGQSYSVGENFLHETSSPISFDVTAIPVDASGALLHDKKVEGKGTGIVT